MEDHGHIAFVHQGVHFFLPFFLSHISPGENTVGIVIVLGFDHPAVFIFLYILDIQSRSILSQPVGGEHVLLDIGSFLLREEFLRNGIQQGNVDHLGVGHRCPEMSDHHGFFRCHRVDQRLAFLVSLGHVAGADPAVDGVEGHGIIGVPQGLPVKIQFPDIHEADGHSPPLKSVQVSGDIAHGHRFFKVGDQDVGVLFCVFIGGIGLQESIHPAVKELEFLRFMILAEFFKARGQLHRFTPDLGSGHGCRAVRVEFAELKAAVLLIQEEVKTADGKLLFIITGQKDQVLHLFGKGEDLPVFRVLHVSADHFAQDPVGHADRFFHKFQFFLPVKCRDKGEGGRETVDVTVGIRHILRCLFSSFLISLEIPDDVQVFISFFFHYFFLIYSLFLNNYLYQYTPVRVFGQSGIAKPFPVCYDESKD